MRKTTALCALCAVSFALAGCTLRVRTGDDPPPPPKAQPAPPPPAKAPPPAQTAKPTQAKPAGPKQIFFGRFKKNSRGEVELPGPVLFETGTATLKPESDAVLEVVVQYLQAKPEITKLRIEGHTDTDGSNTENMKLSKDRAMAVSAWLVGKGIDCKRLVAVGFGEEKLLVTPENNADDKARNRRVVFIDAEIKGQPVDGKPIDGGAPGELAGDACK